MSDDTLLAPTLFDLLGRAWTLPGPVGQAVFGADGSTVAFAGGGRLALAPIADPERSETRVRRAADTGRLTILPRQSPVRPAAMAEGVTGPVVPWGAKSFLTGSAKGGLVSVTPRGQVVPLAVKLAGPPTALARSPVALTVAVAVGERLFLLPDDIDAAPVEIAPQDPITALAFSPDGTRLAVGWAGGVAFVENGEWIGGVALDGTPATFSFSPDGSLLAAGLTEPGFALIRPDTMTGELVQDYPTPSASFAWNAAAGVLATSGAFRTVAWEVSAEGLGEPVEAGRNGLVIVERVAASPDRPLIAAGYASGLICVARLNGRDEMMLRGHGGAVSAMTWAADGIHLAVGDAEGCAALLAFPPTLFK